MGIASFCCLEETKSKTNNVPKNKKNDEIDDPSVNCKSLI